MPRGYGGVGILWKKQIDHRIRTCQDGGNRIQCVEVKENSPLLLISVYMPCRGLSENLEDFNECLDQLNEIIQKYMSTHIIFIGGDWNEDIYLEAQSRRKQNMKDFLLENDLVTTQTQKTYIAPTGATVSTLDYIFYPKTFGENVKTLHVLEDLKVNVSDHLPVCCIINFSLDKATSTNIHKQVKPRVQWAKG